MGASLGNRSTCGAAWYRVPGANHMRSRAAPAGSGCD